ncbi:MAG: antibiotic biosynthesis monooxygenase family protein [Gammaproteobacteria bacterium]|jgi:heme-degrading monooxygenase HmoA
MYAVIFKAEVNEFDQQYFDMVETLRALAKDQYGCIDIISATEGLNEITISYWNSLDDIKKWKQDEVHQDAQRLGKEKWYTSYKVQIVEVMREY